MNLKGRTTIQIRDAETGVIKAEVTDDNLVTNAVNNVLNGALNCLMTTSESEVGNFMDWCRALTFSEGFAKDLFGGVLIFSSAVTEEASHVLPSTAEMNSFVGCGCQGASPTGDKFRGSLNAQETVIGDDYCKFVWDFTTEQANGDIAAICLTSNMGGAVGFKQNVSPLEGDIGHSTIRALTYSMFGNESNSDSRWGITHLLGSSRDYRHGVMFHNNILAEIHGDTLTYRDISNAQRFYLNLTNKNDVGKIYDSEDEPTIDISSGYDDDYWIPVVDEGHYCYASETSISYTDNFKVHRFDVDGSEVIYTLNLKPFVENVDSLFGDSDHDDTTIDVTKFIFNNKLYFIIPYIGNTPVHPNLVRVYCMDLTNTSGAYTMHETHVTQAWLDRMGFDGRFTSKVSQAFVVCSLLGEVYFGLNPTFDGKFNYSRLDSNTLEFDENVTNYSWTSSITTPGFGVLNKVPWASAPWLGTKVDGTALESETVFGNLVLFMPYLATINNISKVLTKTAANTMKIIYTITRTSNS